MVKVYTGIGSRTITPREENVIKQIAELMASRGAVVYSGNAKGSDISFQIGSEGKCLVSLPWSGFNKYLYDYEKDALDYFCVPETLNDPMLHNALISVDKFHPSPKNLKA